MSMSALDEYFVRSVVRLRNDERPVTVPPVPWTETPMYFAPTELSLSFTSLITGEWPSEVGTAAVSS